MLSADIDEQCRETYALNFNEVPHGDVRTIHQIDDFDFLLAGFPCQPFSYAGNRKGFGDIRGTLFFEIERILKTHQPDAFLLENVRGLTTHDQGRTFHTILQHLKALGYSVEYRILNALSYGVPQNRVRVYIFGFKGQALELMRPVVHHQIDIRHHGWRQPDFSKKVIKDILEKEVDEKYYCSDKFVQALKKVVGDDLNRLHGVRLIDYRGGNSLHSWDLGLKGACTKAEKDFMNALIRHRRLKSFGANQDGKRLSLEQISTFFQHDKLAQIAQSLEQKGYLKQKDGKYNPVAGNMSFEVFKFLDPNSGSITLVASDANRLGVVQNGRARRITPREAARIQGYPDNFQLHPDDRVAYRQLGNAVAVPVVTEVLKDFLRPPIQNNRYYSSDWSTSQTAQQNIAT